MSSHTGRVFVCRFNFTTDLMHGLRIDGRQIDVRLEKWNGTRVYLRPHPQNVVWTLGVNRVAPYLVPRISLGRWRLGRMASQRWGRQLWVLTSRQFARFRFHIRNYFLGQLMEHGLCQLSVVLVRLASSGENAFILGKINNLDIMLRTSVWLCCQHCRQWW